ncbi:MAG TPA: GNAT family N-acetyltransferase, partial [Candidatus Dormibacteraeota bacterium]|nr:GNAT family N-acetyltransferase [Candidatus Dormibacteraeota bacterium]
MTASAAAPAVSHARWAELDAETAYAILQLRTLVFVVEQRCVYQDLDGRDLEETALQLWISDAGRVVSAARLLVEPGGAHRIGKVATHPDHRRRGFARALVARALQLA